MQDSEGSLVTKHDIDQDSKPYQWLFLREVLADVKAVSVKQQIAMNAFFLIVFGIFQILTEPPGSSIAVAAFKALLMALGTVYSLIIIFCALRAPFVIHRRQRGLINNLRLQAQTPQDFGLVKQLTGHQNIISPNLKLIRTTVRELEYYHHIAIATFKNEGEYSLPRMKAQITYYDHGGDFYEQINVGAWLSDRTKLEVKAGEICELLIAHKKIERMGVPGTRQLFGFGHMSSKMTLSKAGNRQRVAVRIIAGELEEIIGNFEFTLTLEPEFRLEPTQTVPRISPAGP